MVFLTLIVLSCSYVCVGLIVSNDLQCHGRKKKKTTTETTLIYLLSVRMKISRQLTQNNVHSTQFTMRFGTNHITCVSAYNRTHWHCQCASIRHNHMQMKYDTHLNAYGGEFLSACKIVTQSERQASKNNRKPNDNNSGWCEANATTTTFIKIKNKNVINGKRNMYLAIQIQC